MLRICGYSERRRPLLPAPALLLDGPAARGPLRRPGRVEHRACKDRFSVSAFWDDVRLHGATVGHCVFSIPKMLEQAPPTARRSRQHRFAACSTPSTIRTFEAALRRQVHRELRAHRGRATRIYNRFDEPVVPGSCGRVSDDWEVRLADADGQRGAARRRPARSCSARRSRAAIMLGYLNKAEATAAAFRDLWFHTGDLARRDETGFYFYQGRNKDVIRRRGQNISAWEVEQILLQPPRRGRRRRPGASLGGRRGRPPGGPRRDGKGCDTIDLAGVAAFCERRMPAFMVPALLRAGGTIFPKTPSGRVEKYKLEGKLAAGAFDRGAGRPAQSRPAPTG